MSGSIDITPGKQLAENEPWTRAGLNEGFKPTGQVGANQIGTRELIASAVRQIVPSVNRNVLINGNFDVWQRGGYIYLAIPSFRTVLGDTANAEYGADRWFLGTPSGANKRNISRSVFVTGQSEVPNEPAYYLHWNQLVAETGANRPVLSQPIEDVRTLAGKSVVASWWMKGNYSGDITCRLSQFFGGNPGSTRLVAATSGGTATLSSAASWTKFTAKFDIPSLAGYSINTPNASLSLQFLLPDNATFQIDFAQVQLEEGTDATVFETLSYLDQVRRCERYFEYNAGVAASSITTVVPCYYFATRKYRAPTLTLVAGYSGTGLAFAALLDTGYYQTVANSVVTTFFMACEAEIFL